MLHDPCMFMRVTVVCLLHRRFTISAAISSGCDSYAESLATYDPAPMMRLDWHRDITAGYDVIAV
jgi:hypothetical protein